MKGFGGMNSQVEKNKRHLVKLVVHEEERSEVRKHP